MNAVAPLPRVGFLQQIRADIACVFARDPAARTTFEVITTYPGVHALIGHRLAHGLWRRGWRFLARFLAFFVRMVTHIDIHPGAVIGQRCFIDHGCGVVIGETAEIGDDVTLYHGVTLGGTSWRQGKRHPTVGRGVVIGAGAKVLGPITLGDHVRVGANSVVVKDIGAGKTVVGIPGKVVQTRRGEGIDLNHHLMPDPVAGAISCLLDRIGQLEHRLGVRHAPDGRSLDKECKDCQAVQVCAGDVAPQEPVSWN